MRNNGRTEYRNNGITFNYRKWKCFELSRHGMCNWSSPGIFFWTHFRPSLWMTTHLRMCRTTPSVYLDLGEECADNCQEDYGCKKSYFSGHFKQQQTSVHN